jgi:serine protease inhibitor
MAPGAASKIPASTGDRKRWDSNDRIFDRMLETASTRSDAPIWDGDRDGTAFTSKRMGYHGSKGMGADEYIFSRQIDDIDGTVAGAMISKYQEPRGAEQWKGRSGLNPRNDFDLYDNDQTEDAEDVASGVDWSDVDLHKDTFTPASSAIITRGDDSVCNRFALQTIADVGRGSGSIFMGPFSIISLLTLLHRCSTDVTERELAKMMCAPGCNKEKVYRDLMLTRNSLVKCPSFKCYNAILYSSPLRNSFTQLVTGVADLLPVSQWEMVNQRVSATTNGLIPRIITGAPDGLHAVTLVNAIYFKANWRVQFSRFNTQGRSFYSNPARQVTSMQHSDKTFRYLKTAAWKIVELDYVDGEFCMGFILPQQAGFEIGAFQLSSALSAMQPTELNTLQIPKFTQKTKLDLVNHYKAKGVSSLFSAAQLPFMTERKDLMVGKIMHEATVIVDETGTEAAAATSISMSFNSAPKRSVETFIADRPFYYYIRHMPTSTIVFAGQFC